MKTRGLILLGSVLLAAAAVFIGCKKKEEQPAPPPTPESAMEQTKESATQAAASVEQTMCPIMDGNKINKDVFVEYKGKKVYFCCPDCKGKFLAEPEKYLSKLPQFQQ